MKMTFPTEFDIGDKVKILAGEHNDNWRSRMAIGLFYNVHVAEDISKEREHNYNWDGRIGRITEIGIDLCQVVYIVEFRSEPFKPCFKGEELELVSRKSQAKPLKEIIIDAKYEIGDKVKVLPRARSLRATIEIDGKVCSEFMDNHMPLEELNHYYENKIGWFSKKENEHEWFNNIEPFSKKRTEKA